MVRNRNRRNIISLVGLAAAMSLGGATAALAQGEAAGGAQTEGGGAHESAGTTLKIGALESHIGAQYRSEISYSDNGLLKTATTTPDKTTDVLLNAVKLYLNGDISKDIEYRFRINLEAPINYANCAGTLAGATTGGGATTTAIGADLKSYMGRFCSPDVVEYAKATWWFAKPFGLTVGQDKPNQASFAALDKGYDTFVDTPYVDYMMPFNLYQPMLEAHADVLGMFTAQILNDTDIATGYGSTTGHKQVAWTLQWLGDFGPVKPLLQYGSYDVGHSKYFSAGVKLANLAGLDASVDYTQDMRALNLTGKQTLTYRNYDVGASYNIADVATPFVQLGKMNVSGDNSGGANAPLTPFDEAKGVPPLLTNNATTYAVGAYFLTQGNALRPYVAFTGTQGKMAEGTTTATRTQQEIKLGAMGEF